MKFFVVAFAFISVAAAAGIASDYLPPVTENSLPNQEYVPPAADDAEGSAESAVGADGYRYKVVRKLKFRQRRDVSELPPNEYLPPVEESQDLLQAAEQEEQATTLAPEEETAVKGEDGYRYKTVRRLKYRYRTRRDVNEVSANEYLPPAVDAAEEVIATEAPVEETIDDSAVKSADGYQYKTVRRLKYRYRHRRDVNELPAGEYLPPTVKEVADPVSEYLPPAAEETVEVTVNNAPDAEPEESAVKDDDGYHYKVVRRLKYRQRRDVNEAPTSEYLPPVDASAEVASTETPEPADDSAVKAADGYRYKVVRRLKYRHRTRREVNDAPAYEYGPPAAEKQAIVETIEVPEDSAVKSEDGYRYKVIRRIRYRHRRDVNEEPANEYLPPAEENVESAITELPVEEPVEVVSDESAVKAADGYHYKTVRRLKYRQRRNVNEVLSNDYLPPTENAEPASEYLPPPAVEDDSVAVNAAIAREPEESGIKDAEVASTETPVEESADESAVKAADGYRYKVVRRLKYRNRTRRDVDEAPANEYLPPAEENAEAAVTEIPVEAADESAVKAADGYRYKVVRRLKYRQRRDVDEAPANEYLPPTVESKSAEVAVEQSEDSEDTAKLAEDGYQYKVVRRLKYRRH